VNVSRLNAQSSGHFLDMSDRPFRAFFLGHISGAARRARAERELEFGGGGGCARVRAGARGRGYHIKH
jgi:hypothetical protein